MNGWFIAQGTFSMQVFQYGETISPQMFLCHFTLLCPQRVLLSESGYRWICQIWKCKTSSKYCKLMIMEPKRCMGGKEKNDSCL